MQQFVNSVFGFMLLDKNGIFCADINRWNRTLHRSCWHTLHSLPNSAYRVFVCVSYTAYRRAVGMWGAKNACGTNSLVHCRLRNDLSLTNEIRNSAHCIIYNMLCLIFNSAMHGIASVQVAWGRYYTRIPLTLLSSLWPMPTTMDGWYASHAICCMVKCNAWNKQAQQQAPQHKEWPEKRSATKTQCFISSTVWLNRIHTYYIHIYFWSSVFCSLRVENCGLRIYDYNIIITQENIYIYIAWRRTTDRMTKNSNENKQTKPNTQQEKHKKKKWRSKSETAEQSMVHNYNHSRNEDEKKNKQKLAWQKDAKPQNVDENISVLFIDEHARSVSTETGQVFAVFQSFWTLSSRLSAGIARHDDDNMSWPNVKKGY